MKKVLCGWLRRTICQAGIFDINDVNGSWLRLYIKNEKRGKILFLYDAVKVDIAATFNKILNNR